MIKPTITIDDFAKLDLRIGTVLSSERKEGSEKLIRLTVDFGEDGKRNILTGIAPWYQAEELLNKQFLFVFNLLPRKMMDEESEGMILAANGEKPILIVPQIEAIPGASIR